MHLEPSDVHRCHIRNNVNAGANDAVKTQNQGIFKVY